MEDKELEKLQKCVKENAEKISGCKIFTAIFTENYLKEAYPVLQMTIAIMLDKPIYLLVEEGYMPNGKILKICDGWEFFKRGDEKSLGEATKRLLEMAKLNGHFKEV